MRSVGTWHRGTAKIGLETSTGSDVFDDIDVSFNDPNIRAATGSVFHAGTDADRADFIEWRNDGMSNHDTTQKLARRIAHRLQSVTEVMSRGDVRTFTLMLPGDPDGTLSKRPRYVISQSTYIYTPLSTKGGGSPPFYWSPGVSFLMLDNWTQAELDIFAPFHGVAAVVSLELSNEEANDIIDLANSKTIRNTAPLPTTS